MINPIDSYSSFVALVLSDTALVTFDALYVGVAGTVIISPNDTAPGVTFTAPQGILKIAVRSGRVLTGGTATGLIALQ